jgi:autotransporter-associated beta strand protein
MKKLFILFVFFAGQLSAQNSNLSIVSGATSGGTWSPVLTNGTTGTTYTFTPDGDNATVSKTEIDDLLRVKTSNVIINTVCSACTQTGQIDFNTALSSYNQNGVLSNKTLTFNASADVNIGNPVTLRSTTTYAGNLGSLSLVINTPGNINVTAEILLNNTSEVGSSVILTQGGSVTLNSTAGSVKVTRNINCSGTNNTTNSGLYNGTGGSITIKGAAGVTISGTLFSTSRIDYAGAITVLDGNTNVTMGGVNDGISGVMKGGAFKKMGSGTLKLSGTNNAVSSSELADGTLQLAGGTALPDYNTLSFTGANTTLDLNGFSESIGSIASNSGYGKVTSSVAGNITLTLGLSNLNTTYTGLIEDGLGVLSLAKYGESFSLGNVTHSQANTYTGLTTIYAGTLSIYNGRSLGSTSGGTIVRGTGKLALNNNINVGAEDLTLNLNGVSLSNVSGDNTYGGAISLGQNTTINSTAGTLSLTQTMTGNNFSLATTGAGSMTLSGTLTLGTGGVTNNMGTFSLYSAGIYSGATTVSSGIVHIRNSGSLGSGAVTVALGGSLQLQGGIAISNTLSLKGTGPLGTGALQSVAGINAVSGTITLTGDTRMNADLNSQLTLNSNLSAGAAGLTIGGAGNILLNGSLSGSGSLANTWGTSPIQLNVATSLIKDGTGSLTLNAANSYTGATVISSGNLALGATEVINNAAMILFNGGKLSSGGYSETLGPISILSEGSEIELGAGVHELRFGTKNTWDFRTLNISGWQGNAGISGTDGRIYVENSAVLSLTEVEQVKFSTANAIQLISGELVPNAIAQSGNANIRFTTGITVNGTWSPALLSGATNTTYTFTPSANHANINPTDVDLILRTRYSHATINTACVSCSQSGIINVNTPIETWNDRGPTFNKFLTINAASDANILSPIVMRYATDAYGDKGILSFYLNTAGSIYVNAAINTNIPLSRSSTIPLTDGGSVYLNSTAGSVFVNAAINTSGAVSTTNASSNSGVGGTISITGAGGVSVYNTLTATGRTYGNLTFSTGNNVVTTGNGVNDGITRVMIGRTLSKSGTGTLQLSAANQVSDTYMYGGILRIGIAGAIPSYSTINFSGGQLNDGGFSSTLGTLYVYNNATITLGNSAHELKFTNLGSLSATKMLTFEMGDGSVADLGLNTYGAFVSTSTSFVNPFGKKQSTLTGALSRFGTVVSSIIGAPGSPVRVYLGYDLSTSQKAQVQFYNTSLAKYYTTTQKPVAVTNGEMLPLAPK